MTKVEDNGRQTSDILTEDDVEGAIERSRLKTEVQTPPDPFDMSRIRQSQDFSPATGVRKTIKCKLKKPPKEWWIQTHPDEGYRIEAPVLDLKEERETYWVVHSLWDDLRGEPAFINKVLIVWTAKHTWSKNDYFLWQIRMPGVDGKIDDWNRSALEYALQTGMWQRITSNMDLGEYDQWLSEFNWQNPEWPETSFDELVRSAFRGRVIDSMDHPVLAELRGRVS